MNLGENLWTSRQCSLQCSWEEVTPFESFVYTPLNAQSEKNELREEKLVLKADKEKMEVQLKSMAMSAPGYMPAAYQNKMVYPSYSLVPMWHYLPPSTRDTSRDHELRPPAA